MEAYSSSSSMFEVKNLFHSYRILYRNDSLIYWQDIKTDNYRKIYKEFLLGNRSRTNELNKIIYISRNYELPVISPTDYNIDRNNNFIGYNAEVPKTTLKQVLNDDKFGKNTDGKKIRYLTLVKEAMEELHNEGIINTNFDVDNIFIDGEKVSFIIDNCIIPKLRFDINTTDYFYDFFTRNGGDINNYDSYLFNILSWQVINDYNNPFMFNYRFDTDNKSNFSNSKLRSEDNIKILQKMRNCERSELLIDNLLRGIY